MCLFVTHVLSGKTLAKTTLPVAVQQWLTNKSKTESRQMHMHHCDEMRRSGSAHHDTESRVAFWRVVTVMVHESRGVATSR